MLNFKLQKITFLVILILIVTLALATFFQNTMSSEEASILVYSTIWFEILGYLFAALLILSIVKFKMYRKDKIPVFLFHISFILIILGASLTKHYGFKGSLHVEEYTSSNQIYTQFNYMRIKANKNGKNEVQVYKGLSGFNKSLEILGKPLRIEDKKIFKNAKKILHVTPGSGEGLLAFEILSQKGREKHVFTKENFLELENVDILFNTEPKKRKKPYFKIIVNAGKEIGFISSIDVVSNFEKMYEKDKLHKFHPGILYRVGEIQLLASSAIVEGKVDYIATDMPLRKSVFTMSVNYDGVLKDIALIEDKKYESGYESKFNIQDTEFYFKWGQKKINLPFSIYLKKFDIINYPGSKDIASYESKIILKDKEVSFDKIIKINEPLSYKGYTIFQTKYNRHGSTIFEINYNPGKWFFYIAYILLTFGLLLNLFNPKSRAKELMK